jgi:hypothetical protein
MKTSFLTVVESPQAQFRREAGLSPFVSSSRPRVGDWMKLSCGDRVREKGGRHVGTVEAIHWSHTVKVRWEETGWTSELLFDEVERIGRKE